MELKREEPRRSVPHILRMLQAELDDPIDVTPGALWRHLAKEGLGGHTTSTAMSAKPSPPTGIGRIAGTISQRKADSGVIAR